MATQTTTPPHPLALHLARAINERANEFAHEHGLNAGRAFNEISEASREHLTRAADAALRDIGIEQAPEEGEYLMRLRVPTMKVGDSIRYACCNCTPDQGHADNCTPQSQKEAIAAALVRANIVGDWTHARPVSPLLAFRLDVADESDRMFAARVLDQLPDIDPYDDEAWLTDEVAHYTRLLHAAAQLAVRDQHHAVWEGNGNAIEGKEERPDRIPVEEMTPQEHAAYTAGREEATPGVDVEERMVRFRDSVQEQAGPEAANADHLMWCYAYGWSDAMRERTGYEDPEPYVLPKDSRLSQHVTPQYAAEILNDLVSVERIRSLKLGEQPRDGETITIHDMLGRSQQFVFSDGKKLRPIEDGICVLIRPTLHGTVQNLCRLITDAPIAVDATYREGPPYEIQLVDTVRRLDEEKARDTVSVAPEDGYEKVDHPPHYNQHPAGIECIDVIEHFPHNIGAAMKYLWRVGLKPGEDFETELGKAVWYAQREITRLQGGAR